MKVKRHLSEKVWSVAKLEGEKLDQNKECWFSNFLEKKNHREGRVGMEEMKRGEYTGTGQCFTKSRDGVCLELDWGLARLTAGLVRGQLCNQEQDRLGKPSDSCGEMEVGGQAPGQCLKRWEKSVGAWGGTT
ncbi:hypothetical protein EDC04DRAFT_2597756 [Pisolithus marmoratus]|nr:hypothetical protein EDC04DRAFT_2597756 [Pisolithus marmoratus]